ncbi:MAG: hypothetical protein L0G99_11355 [Propionibacteriales bacterium]|nr:hypothetical protein [Propionibacteriales bacterium]
MAMRNQYDTDRGLRRLPALPAILALASGLLLAVLTLANVFSLLTQGGVVQLASPWWIVGLLAAAAAFASLLAQTALWARWLRIGAGVAVAGLALLSGYWLWLLPLSLALIVAGCLTTFRKSRTHV